MFNKKCPNCAKKTEKDFNFCPYCGLSFKQQREEEEFGILGRDDDIIKEMKQEMKLPMGMDKLMNSLIKQLDKELGGLGMGSGNFKIQISNGAPEQQIRKTTPLAKTEKIENNFSAEEMPKRKNLPKKEAQSNVRRLSDRIVYEISVPGVKEKENIVISKLENGIEIKAYSKDLCYSKIIPLKMDILRYKLKDGVLFLELKS